MRRTGYEGGALVSSIRRREFILLGGSAAATSPIAARAQQPSKLPTIGLLVPGTPASHGQWFAVLVQRLREFGWIEGRTVALEVRWAEGRVKGLAEIAAEFVRLKVDVIVTSGTPAVVQAMQATSVIPIVSAVMGDPVASGLVASLARPGGNVTGLSVLAPDLGGKRLEFLREVVPGLRRLAFLGNVNNSLSSDTFERSQITRRSIENIVFHYKYIICLLYTSDAADE